MLEGDKTNWIPSYFEGMQSSFEDKLQDDGMYKMEILSNNRNIISKDFLLNKDNYNTEFSNYGWWYIECNVKPNTRYTISRANNADSYNLGYMLKITNKPHYNASAEWLIANHVNCTNKSRGFISSYDGKLYLFVNNDIDSIKEMYEFSKGIQLEEGSNMPLYEPYNSNKIQFSSIEPLRGIGDIKDRFVFKDGKLMIERNTKGTVLVGSTAEGWSEPSSHTINSRYLLFSSKKTNEFKAYSKIYSDRFMTPNETNAGDNSLWKIDREGIGHTVYSDIRIRIDRERLSSPNKAGFMKWLSENPTKIVYELEEPIYEEMPHELQKIILEGYKNGTLYLDTNIPPTVTASYTANIPVVSKLNKVNETTEINTEDIAITQMAVDFLLMSSLGEEMLNFKLRSGYNMASYFASRIIKGALKYEDVVNKYPQYKEDINSILASEGYSDLIVEL